MIRINLLPFRAARKKEGVRLQIGVYAFCVLITAAGLFWFNSNLKGEIEDLNTDIRNTQAELEKYKKIVQEVEAIQKKLDILRNRLDVIKKLDVNRENAFWLLDTINSMVVEKRMWFTNFQALERVTGGAPPPKRGRKKGGGEQPAEQKVEIQISINGVALDNKTVADFMTRLQEATILEKNIFKDVQLRTLQKTAIKENVNLKSFHITCTAVPLAEVIKEEEQKKS